MHIPVVVFLNSNLFKPKYFKINVCRCPVSGLKGFFFTNNFLIIENKVSKAGYHKKFTAKIGETYGELLINDITNTDIKIDKIYIPESPK